VDLSAGIFVDQGWLDLAPGYFEGVQVLRDLGINVAYWNLNERPLAKTPEGRLLVGDSPLTCYHFSSFNPSSPQCLSRHIPTAFAALPPALQELMTGYADQLRRAGWEAAQPEGSAFSKLKDGTVIEPAWREAIRQGRLPDVRDPFDPDAARDLAAQLSSEGQAAGPLRLDWRIPALEDALKRASNEEERWRKNYWRLARTFPVTCPVICVRSACSRRPWTVTFRPAWSIAPAKRALDEGGQRLRSGDFRPASC
jgi:hypothetical protein